MSIKTYILILFILAAGLFNNRFTSAILSKDISLILTFLWGIIGWVYFPRHKGNQIDNIKNRLVALGIFTSMLLSMLIPWINYNQSILDTFISQRFNYAILLLLVLLRIQPRDKDIIYAIKISAYISIIGYIISLINPTFFRSEETIKELLNMRIETDSKDIGFSGPGYSFVPIYIYIILQQYINYPRIKKLIEASIFIVYIILVQNRSFMIGTLPFFFFCIFFTKSHHKKIIILIFIGMIIFIFPIFKPIIDSLINETQVQIADSNYNRWQAISFYLIEMKNNLSTILLGNGVRSNSGEYLQKMVMAQLTRGTYVSDIGWLGTYYYYGVFPVLILLWFAFKALIKKEVPIYLKFFSIWIITVPTIHAYLNLTTSGALEFSIYFYLIIYYMHYRELKIKQSISLKSK